ncbi:carbohydrate sulfotransferase 1-like [Limulus polyphemus]|uniref:Carbohydrate sulfotransferase 1-like n=1 Tax=Limulus polyphemus TaxID=6850 RepID=A0ABM1BLS3_LIMPO|nr:carbohydrate sulfotransferase 1-like [Limulus polyphemus]
MLLKLVRDVPDSLRYLDTNLSKNQIDPFVVLSSQRVIGTIAGDSCSKRTSVSTLNLVSPVLFPSASMKTQSVYILPAGNISAKIRTSYKVHINEKKKVILLSYLRSGSTFLGEMFNQHPSVFYYFEPLYLLDHPGAYSGIQPLFRSKVPKALKLLNRILDCKISKNNGLINDDLAFRSKALREIYDTPACNSTLTRCLDKACEQKNVSVIKVMRLYLNDLQPLIERNDLKVIILQRDPRALLYSRRRNNLGGRLEIEDDFRLQARSLCARMLHDVKMAKKIAFLTQKNFYRIVLQEHFVTNPQSIIKSIFRFLELPITDKQIKSLLEVSHFPFQQGEGTLYRWDWKKEVLANEVVAIDKVCHYFYENSFYKAITDGKNVKNKHDKRNY